MENKEDEELLKSQQGSYKYRKGMENQMTAKFTINVSIKPEYQPLALSVDLPTIEPNI